MKLHIYENNPDTLPTFIQGKEALLKAFSYNVIKSDRHDDNPDFFIVPVLFLLDKLNKIENNAEAMKVFCESLPYWKGNEARHIFLDESDHSQKPAAIKDSLLFTVTPDIKDPTHRAFPFFPHKHNSFDAHQLMQKSINSATFDLFFKGCDTNIAVRKAMLNLIPFYESTGLTAYVQKYNTYFWLRDITEEQKMLERRHYFERLVDSKFVLCPRGVGKTSARFFETLYFGRIPILISDEVRLPLENKINWSEIIIRVKENEMEDLPLKVREFKESNNLELVKEKILKISHTYFVRDSIVRLIEETLE